VRNTLDLGHRFHTIGDVARLDELDDASRAQDVSRAEQILTQCVAGFERPAAEAESLPAAKITPINNKAGIHA
jgi:hypothetical protein